MRRLILCHLATLVAVFAAVPLLAQTGGLEVRVFDAETRQPLAGVTVQLTSELSLVPPLTLLSDGDGRASFPVLRVGGGYVIDVALAGYGRQRVSDLRIGTDRTERLVLQLSNELQERVRVKGRRDVVDLEQTGNSSRFDEEFIAGIPLIGREYQDLLSLAPGVKDADGDGNPNVHGARSRDFKAQVGGVSNVDPLTGKWLSLINLDSIEELEVIASGAGVEFSRAQGGFARIIQKQGSNDFEGAFSILYRSSIFDGDGAGTELRLDEQDFETLQPALALSGPLRRDRLWYRMSWEYLDREDPVNFLSGTGVTTRTQTVFDAQVTWQAAPRNKLAVQFQYDPVDVGNQDLSSSRPAESTSRFERGGPTWTLRWTAAQSARLIVESLVAYQDSEVKLLPSDPAAQQDCVFFFRYQPLNETHCYDVTRNVESGPFRETSLDRRQRMTARSDATWYAGRFLGAEHRVKTGIIVENERYFRDLRRRPDIILQRFSPLFPPPAEFGIATIEAPVPGGTKARATGISFGVYVEDQLRLAAGLSLTLGLRYDREEIDSLGREPFDPAAEAAAFRALRAEEPHLPASRISALIFTAFENAPQFRQQLARVLGVDPSTLFVDGALQESSFWNNVRRAESIALRNGNLAPRLTIAWDPWNNGKTKLAVSAGRYYDKIFLAIPLVELEPATTRFPQEFSSAFRPGDTLIDFSQLGPARSPRARRVSRGLRTPYQDEVTASFERAIGHEASIKLTYIDRAFRDQLQDTDINHDENNIVFNPGWGEFLEVGNLNETDYRAWVVELVRRQFAGWQLNASYTWSEAVGDAEDFDQVLGNNPNLARGERSFLKYDQTHLALVSVVGLTPWGFRAGGTLSWQSGLPFSNVVLGTQQFFNPPEYDLSQPGSQVVFFYPSGERNDRRNASYWNVDLKLAREFRVKDSVAQVSLELLNALDDDTLIIDDFVLASPLTVFGTPGLDPASFITSGPSATRRFGRQFQIGFRINF